MCSVQSNTQGPGLHRKETGDGNPALICMCVLGGMSSSMEIRIKGQMGVLQQREDSGLEVLMVLTADGGS